MPEKEHAAWQADARRETQKFDEYEHTKSDKQERAFTMWTAHADAHGDSVMDEDNRSDEAAEGDAATPFVNLGAFNTINVVADFRSLPTHSGDRLTLPTGFVPSRNVEPYGSTYLRRARPGRQRLGVI